jgi:hypothetical protein
MQLHEHARASALPLRPLFGYASPLAVQESKMVKAPLNTPTERCTLALTKTELALDPAVSSSPTARSTLGNTSTTACVCHAPPSFAGQLHALTHFPRSGTVGAP